MVNIRPARCFDGGSMGGYFTAFEKDASLDVSGWRRCHAQMVWQAMQAVLAFSCWVTLKQRFAVALEREQDGSGTWRETQSAFVDGLKGSRAAGWDDQIP